MGSGRFGLVNGLSRVSNWQVNDSKNADAYQSSNTAAGTARGGGVRDWNGSFSGQGGSPPVMPNQEFLFEGYTEPDNGVLGGDGLVYTGQAIVSQVAITWNWTNNQLLRWSANFAGKPGLTFARATPTVDTSALADEFACGTYFEYGVDDAVVDIEIPALTSATLTITANLAPASNSSTRSGGECFIDRTPGNIDWNLSMNQEDRDRGVSGYPDLGQDVGLKLYTKADLSEFWALNFGRKLSYTNLTVDTQSNNQISRTLNYAMQARLPSTGALGNITLPGETVPYWGQGAV